MAHLRNDVDFDVHTFQRKLRFSSVYCTYNIDSAEPFAKCENLDKLFRQTVARRKFLRASTYAAHRRVDVDVRKLATTAAAARRRPDIRRIRRASEQLLHAASQAITSSAHVTETFLLILFGGSGHGASWQTGDTNVTLLLFERSAKSLRGYDNLVCTQQLPPAPAPRRAAPHQLRCQEQKPSLALALAHCE